MKNWLLRASPLLLLAVLLAWRAFDIPPTPALRLAGFDWMHGAVRRGPDNSGAPVIVVQIDDESRRRLGAWPWPRTVLARLVERMEEAGARVVAFDIVFDTPDHLSPERILPYWPETPETDALRERLRELPGHDRLLADALAEARGVLSFLPVQRETERLPDLKAEFEGPSDMAGQFLDRVPGAVANITLLEAAAFGNGARLWAEPESDVVRRVPLAIRIGERVYPGFAAEIVRAWLGLQRYELTLSAGGSEGFVRRSGLTGLRLGQSFVPTDASGNLRLYYGPADARRAIPAWRVLDSAFTGEGFGDAAVIVSLAGELESAGDRRYTPFGETISRAEAQAQAVEQILSQAYLKRSNLAPAIELGFLLVAGAVVAFLMLRWVLWMGIGAFLLLELAGFGATWYLFTTERLLFDALYPGLALALVFVAALGQRIAGRVSRRLQIRILFGRALAPPLVDRMASERSDVTTDGETRTLSLLYAHIRGFSVLVGRRGPREALRLVNMYLSPMTEAVLENRGMIDKFMGDAVMAFWNAPLDDPDHAENACRAALGIGAALERLNQERRSRAGRTRQQFVPVEASIGIVTDRFYVGEIGSERRREYSVLGASTNLAIHLESQTKYYGVSILIGEDTWKQVPEFATLELDLIVLPDQTQPVRIYTVLGDEARANTEEFRVLAERHGEMLRAYRGRHWSAALDAARACLELSGDELADFYELYAARIRAFQRQPPPDNWNGVYRANGPG